MKTRLILIILLFGFTKIYSQDKITVLIGPINSFVETYNKNSYLNEFNLDQAYRLGPTSLKLLKDGVKTSLKWIDLNKTHFKTFQKEVCRFKAMEKGRFKFMGYADAFSTEMIMIFYGQSDGAFKIEIKSADTSFLFLTITNVEMLQGFKNLLDGKTANNEIDDIFKN